MKNPIYPTMAERRSDDALHMVFIGTEVHQSNAEFVDAVDFATGRMDVVPEYHQGAAIAVVDQKLSLPFAEDDQQMEALVVNGFVGVVRQARLYRPK